MVIKKQVGDKRKLMLNKLFALLITGVVITLVIASGPADAFSLSLNINKNSVEQGDKVIFKVSVDSKSLEKNPVSKIVLQLNPVDGAGISCEFSVDGEILNGCEGITILSNANVLKTDNSQGYGYGYGYGYWYNNGKLIYTIKLDTTNYSPGVYNTKLLVYVGNKVLTQDGEALTITPFVEKENKGKNNNQPTGNSNAPQHPNGGSVGGGSGGGGGVSEGNSNTESTIIPLVIGPTNIETENDEEQETEVENGNAGNNNNDNGNSLNDNSGNNNGNAEEEQHESETEGQEQQHETETEEHDNVNTNNNADTDINTNTNSGGDNNNNNHAGGNSNANSDNGNGNDNGNDNSNAGGNGNGNSGHDK